MTSHSRFLVLILAAIVLGAFFGGQFPHLAVYTGFLGDIFLNALKMIVVPLVVASMIVGVTNLGDVRRLGGIGRRSIFYYLATTGVSVTIGLLLVNLIRPGVGIEHGESLPDAAYRVDGTTLVLHEAAFREARYDDRFQVILADQNVAGTVAQSRPDEPNVLSVTAWVDRDSGQPTTPAAAGRGVEVDVGIAEKLRGKDRTIFRVLTDVLVGMVPVNIFKAMVETDVLPLIVFSLLFGGVLTTMGQRAAGLVDLIGAANDAIMKIVHVIIAFAPVGIFALIANRMGNSGGWAGFLPELIKLGWYSGTVISGLLIHGLVVLPLALWLLAHRRVGRYAGNQLPSLSTAFSTASSSATLPLTIECVTEKNGVSNRVASFVLPLGATINMDGTALYEAVAAVFIAQVYGVTMGPVEQIVIFLTATLAAVGAAGIPEAGLVTMVIVLRAVDLPIEGISLILVIDWFLDRCRTTVNVWGDAVGAAVIARYEGEENPDESPATGS